MATFSTVQCQKSSGMRQVSIFIAFQRQNISIDFSGAFRDKVCLFESLKIEMDEEQ